MLIGGAARRLTVPLTPRQHQVLRLIAAGSTAESIARQLYVSLNTAKKISDALYQRLGVHTQGAAVDTGHKLGLLTTPELVALREVAQLLVDGNVDAARDLAKKLVKPAAASGRAEHKP